MTGGVWPWYDFNVKNQITRLTATEAARDFSALLDRVASGAEAIIERHSVPVAVIGPAVSTPRRISECLAVPLLRPSASADPDFHADLADIIAGAQTAEAPKWD